MKTDLGCCQKNKARCQKFRSAPRPKNNRCYTMRKITAVI